MHSSDGSDHTDAIHHRLRGGSPVPGNNYQCYDCSHLFPSLAELGNHSHERPWHSQERCLMCCDHILVYIQLSPPQVVRLHNCKRALLRYQNPDLHVLASDLSHSLGWQTDGNSSPRTIPCGTCDQSFPQTPLGLYKFLEHSNVTSHNVAKTHFCRKCSMPEMILTVSSTKRFFTHYCTKESLSVFKEV